MPLFLNKMKIIFLDFETRSACELKSSGSYEYAKHSTTQVLCASYAVDQGPVHLWNLLEQEPVPKELLDAFHENDSIFVGHNFSNFDRFIWEYTLRLLPICPSRIHDTMVQAYAMGLPGSLEAAAQAVGLGHQKDMKASRVMLQLAKPRSRDPLTWYTPQEFPEKFQTLHNYAKKDTEVARELYNRTLKLSPFERRVFQFDMWMNERGVPVDVPSLKKAIEVVEAEKKTFNLRIQKLTKNAVATANAVGQLMDWLEYKGITTPGVAKSNLLSLLDGPLPDDVRQVLLVRQEAAKASTAKLKAMLSRAGDRQRVACGFQYSGANTRRWAGRGAQFQNFKRGAAPDGFWDALHSDALHVIFDSPMDTIAQSMRGFIKAEPGKKLMGADFSAIEARALAWLAGEEDVLKIFRGDGKIYEFTAAQIYGVPIQKVTPEQRQIGKVATLALGYGGGSKAFQSMAKNYGVRVSDERAEEIKTAWRETNARIVSYWYSLERGAVQAIGRSGVKIQVGPKNRQVTYLKKGSFLWCSLPSRGVICYPYPELRKVTTPWGAEKDAVTYMTVDGMTREWKRVSTYGGSLAENVTQSLSRDLLAEAMLRLDDAGYSVFATIHDEVICEEEIGSGRDVKKLVKIMEEIPAWAKDLPIQAEGWESERYG